MSKKRQKKTSDSTHHIANFLFEAGILSKTPRSFHSLLGSGQQSVAEHITRTMIVGYALAQMNGKVDDLLVIKMCLLHDFAEGRTSDLNYLHQKYATTQEEQAIEDLTSTLPFGEDMNKVIEEYEERISPEAILAKDADNVEFLLSLREAEDTGNTRAATWIPNVVKRMKSPEAKKLTKQILETDSDAWWYADKENEWWVSRKKTEK